MTTTNESNRSSIVRAAVVQAGSEVLAGPKYGEECVLVADLDRSDLARAKFDFDVVGHYSRPDVFRLEVNERAMKSVVFVSETKKEPISEG